MGSSVDSIEAFQQSRNGSNRLAAGKLRPRQRRLRRKSALLELRSRRRRGGALPGLNELTFEKKLPLPTRIRLELGFGVRDNLLYPGSIAKSAQIAVGHVDFDALMISCSVSLATIKSVVQRGLRILRNEVSRPITSRLG